MNDEITPTAPAAEAPAKPKRAAKKAAKAKPKAKPAKAAKPKGLSLLDAAYKVLSGSKAKDGMNPTAMYEGVVAKKLWKAGEGKTPVATLSAAVIRECSLKGKKSRFKKVSPGHYVANRSV